MSKISHEQATEEINGWLDYKKIFQETRDKLKDNTEVLVEAMANGFLTLNPETHEFTQKLLFGTGDEGNSGLMELKYRPRLREKDIVPYMKGVKIEDIDARIRAVIGALTMTPKEVIIALDTQDRKVCNAIAFFFM